jgi:hydrogenase maturation protease
MSSLSEHAVYAGYMPRQQRRRGGRHVPRGGTLVLALGNPLRGDDGIGPAVLEALSAEKNLPPDVTLLDGGTAGLETALLLEGYRRVIIVDAAEMGRAPGEWVRFTPAEAVLRAEDPALRGSLHSAGLGEALQLAGALDVLPDEVIIFGVQPLDTSYTAGLSEPLRSAVPALCAAILDELHRLE